MKHVVERKIGNEVMKIETGRIARQASGSVIVTYGGTMVFCAATFGNPPLAGGEAGEFRCAEVELWALDPPRVRGIRRVSSSDRVANVRRSRSSVLSVVAEGDPGGVRSPRPSVVGSGPPLARRASSNSFLTPGAIAEIGAVPASPIERRRSQHCSPEIAGATRRLRRDSSRSSVV